MQPMVPSLAWDLPQLKIYEHAEIAMNSTSIAARLEPVLPGLTMRNLGPLLICAMALLPLVSHYLLGGGLAYWLSPVVFYLLLPLSDMIVGKDKTNPAEAAEPQLEHAFGYRALLYLYLPLQLLAIVFSYQLLTAGGLSVLEYVGLLESLCIAMALGFAIGHELGHHPQPMDRYLGIWLLAPMAVADFYIYHNIGHHNTVATPLDDGSARYGESIWQFWRRSVVGKSRNAWRIESQRLQKLQLPFWSRHNQMLWITGLSLAWLVGLVGAFGLGAVPVFIAVYLVSRTLLVFADYIEHYGLCRKQLVDGSYEPVQPNHSWNDSHLISNMVFCNVDWHSDHHANPARAYQVLRHFEDVPQLPLGYISLVLPAAIPAWWRRLVHPVVHQLYDQGTFANAEPGALPEQYRHLAQN